MAVPVHDEHPEEVRTRIVADPEHARSILEREFPKGRGAGDGVAGGQPRKVSRIALIVGTVLLMVAAFVAGYVVRGSDSESATDTTPVVAAPMSPVSPDAIDRPAAAAPMSPVSPDAIDRPAATESMTPVSPDAIDRAPVISADMFGSADAAERWLNG
jgi:hypothetical protein